MAPQALDVCSALGIRVRKGTEPGLALARKLEQGFDFGSVERVAKALAPDDRSFVYTLIPRASLKRYEKSGTLTPLASDKVYDMARVWKAAEWLYGDRDKARAFLNRPHSLLEGRRPIDLARASSAGADLVLEIIQRAAAGVAV